MHPKLQKQKSLNPNVRFSHNVYCKILRKDTYDLFFSLSATQEYLV